MNVILFNNKDSKHAEKVMSQDVMMKGPDMPALSGYDRSCIVLSLPGTSNKYKRMFTPS